MDPLDCVHRERRYYESEIPGELPKITHVKVPCWLIAFNTICIADEMYNKGILVCKETGQLFAGNLSDISVVNPEAFGT